MEAQLTAGAIEMIRNEQVKSEKDMVLILQVTQLRAYSSTLQQGTAKERYRMLLSDGTETQLGMLATTQNQLVNNEILRPGSIVRLNSFICNKIEERR